MLGQIYILCFCLFLSYNVGIGSDVIFVNTTKNYTAVIIKVGTPVQKLNVLVDSTNSDLWWLSPDINTTLLSTGQTPYQTTTSNTYYATNNYDYSWKYYEDSINSTGGGLDTVRLGIHNISNSPFGLSKTNPSIISDQGLDGVLALDRTSIIMTNLPYISMEINENTLYFGEYPNELENIANMTVSEQQESLQGEWKFDVELFLPDESYSLIGNGLGIVDFASPYIGISSNDYDSIWDGVDPEGTCNMNTLQCSDVNLVVPYLTIQLPTATFQLDRENYVQNSKLLFQRLPVINESITIVYFGRPFLQTVVVSLYRNRNRNSDWIMFGTPKSSSDSNDVWIKVYIILGSVAAFAIIFFAILCYKYKIPSSSVANIEQPLLAEQHRAQPIGSTTGTAQAADTEEMRTRRLQALSQQPQGQQ